MKQMLLVNYHSETLSTMSELADLHQSSNQFSEAEDLHTEVLSIRRQQFPGNHPLIAASLHHAGLRRMQWVLWILNLR